MPRPPLVLPQFSYARVLYSEAFQAFRTRSLRSHHTSTHPRRPACLAHPSPARPGPSRPARPASRAQPLPPLPPRPPGQAHKDEVRLHCPPRFSCNAIRLVLASKRWEETCYAPLFLPRPRSLSAQTPALFLPRPQLSFCPDPSFGPDSFFLRAACCPFSSLSGSSIVFHFAVFYWLLLAFFTSLFIFSVSAQHRALRGVYLCFAI